MLALALSCILIPLGMLARSSARPPWGDRIAWVGLITMGLFSSLFVFTVLRDALLLILWLASLAGLELGWTALRQASAWWVATLALAATIVGFVNARRLARVVTVDVPIAGLPPDLDGFTIVQISDIHIGPTIKQRYVQAIVDAVNQESPDLVAITGDVVDGSVEQLAAQASPLGQLRAPHGVYLVTGNHEYYSGAAPWVAEFRRMGLRVLMNEHALIHPSGLPMIIAGVTDYSAGAFDPHQRSNPAAAWPARRPMPGHASCWRTSRAARRRRAAGLHPATVGPHAWRAVLSLGLLRAPAAALYRRAAPARQDVDLHQPGHRLLGTAQAAGRAVRDHAAAPARGARPRV